MTDLVTTLPILLFFIAVGSWTIRRFSPREQPLLWLALFLHQAAALANVVVTEYYYGGGDALNYRRFGLVAADRLRQDFFGVAPSLIQLILQRAEPFPIPLPIQAMQGSNTGSMQGIAAFAMYFFNDSLLAASAAIAGAAFLSKVGLYVIASRELPTVSFRSLLFACLLMPSALFWSSGLLKEPIATIGLFTALYAFDRILTQGPRLRSFALLALGSATILLIKGYIFPVFGAAAALWYLVRKIRARRGDLVLGTWHAAIAVGLTLAAVAGTGMLLPEFALDALNDEAAQLQTVGARVAGNSSYSLGAGAGEAGGQLALAPFGLFTALFRPSLFEVSNPLVLFSALEMTGLSVLALMAILRQGVSGAISEFQRQPFLAFCAMFVIVLGTGVGVASTNLGTLTRYRMPLIPLYAILLVALSARRRSTTSNIAPGEIGTKVLSKSPRQPLTPASPIR